MERKVTLSDGNKINIHFVYNKKTGMFDDFKFTWKIEGRFMDNIKISKLWENEEFFEVSLEATSVYVSAKQTCYTQNTEMKNNGRKIKEYSYNQTDDCYVEFGEKKGNSTPAFSLLFHAVDAVGHVQIEVDMEIDDNKDRKHRCIFYVESELGLIEKFGENLIKMSSNYNIHIVDLNNTKY